MKNKLYVVCIKSMSCSTSPRVCFILTQPELNAIKLSKIYFADLCSKLTLIDVFVHMSCFLNCFPAALSFYLIIESTSFKKAGVYI